MVRPCNKDFKEQIYLNDHDEVGYFNKGLKGERADLTALTQGQW